MLKPLSIVLILSLSLGCTSFSGPSNGEGEQVIEAKGDVLYVQDCKVLMDAEGNFTVDPVDVEGEEERPTCRVVKGGTLSNNAAGIMTSVLAIPLGILRAIGGQ